MVQIVFLLPICLILLLIFFIVIRLTEWKIHVRTYNIMLEATIIRDCAKLELHRKTSEEVGDLKGFPCINLYLKQAYYFYSALIDRQEKAIKIESLPPDSKYAKEIVQELSHAPKIILDMVREMCQILDNWYYKDHPIVQQWNKFKKRVVLQILSLLKILLKYLERKTRMSLEDMEQKAQNKIDTENYGQAYLYCFQNTLGLSSKA